MKMKNNPGLGLTMPKRVRIAGMTFYTRNGQVIGRESATHEKRSNTLPQFVQRQKILLATIGAKYNKTAAQVALRWLTQRGINDIDCAWENDISHFYSSINLR